MELTDLKGIGPKKKDLLAKIDIHSVSELYNYYPTSFEDRRKRGVIPNVREDVKYYFIWQITSRLYQNRTKNGYISYIYAIEPDTNEKVKIIYFNDRFTPTKFKNGETYKFFTKVKFGNGTFEAINPMTCDLDDDNIGSIIPIYPLTKGLSQKNISNFIGEALKSYEKDEEIFGKTILDNFKFSSKYDNLLEIHKPSDIDKLMKAKSELKVLDFAKELVYIDYIGKRYEKNQDLGLLYNLDHILSHIGFDLTRSQLIALKEILSDCSSNLVMNRLLIGDVGSGKTIIAIIAMIVFGLNSYQSAMMVPTEVLATQQFEKNLDLIESFGLKAQVLTGSSKDKDKIKKDLADGRINIIIGTHALIQEDVIFKNLKLVINDEQHRFGVNQRQELGLKAEGVNYLSMTATPIPRTISLRLAEILDLSMITELPKGRKPITTKVIVQSMEKILFEEIEANLSQGRQVYIVSNNIDSDDKNSVENLYKRYKKVFKYKIVKKLHGDMKASDKDKTLKDFADGKIDILISTTVIEVGIDVANANTMVIYNANHFGLSSLHQLRGRVGRGSYDSYCYLISKNVDNNSKLNILVGNENGFDIAKKDYDLRGGGKILSAIQHGRNLNQIEYLSMSQDEVDKSFEILDYIRANDYKDVNFSYIEKFFKENKRIILN